MGMYTRFMFFATVDAEVAKEAELAQNKLRGTHPLAIMYYNGSAQWENFESKIFKKDYSNDYHINVDCAFKNYGNEIQQFLDWIKPHLLHYTEPFCGFMLYEEDEEPTLIYYNNIRDEIDLVEPK